MSHQQYLQKGSQSDAVRHQWLDSRRLIESGFDIQLFQHNGIGGEEKSSARHRSSLQSVAVLCSSICAFVHASDRILARQPGQIIFRVWNAKLLSSPRCSSLIFVSTSLSFRWCLARSTRAMSCMATQVCSMGSTFSWKRAAPSALLYPARGLS